MEHTIDNTCNSKFVFFYAKNIKNHLETNKLAASPISYYSVNASNVFIASCSSLLTLTIGNSKCIWNIPPGLKWHGHKLLACLTISIKVIFRRKYFIWAKIRSISSQFIQNSFNAMVREKKIRNCTRIFIVHHLNDKFG